MSKIPQSFKNLEGVLDESDHPASPALHKTDKRRQAIFIPHNSEAMEQHLFKVQNQAGTQPSLHSVNSVESSNKIE